MSKTKVILAAIGGVVGFAVLVMLYFNWAAYSAKVAAIEGDEEEGTDGLDAVVANAQGLSRKPIYPCAASLAAIESNAASIVEWKTEAAKLAARGDRVFEKTTPAAFKTFIVADAKRLAALPGTVAGVLVKPEFTFGPFKDYIAEGKMPAEAQLAELQRRWDDVATITELLAQSGIAELLDVQYKTIEVKEEAKDNRKSAKKPARKAQKNNSAEVKPPAMFAYVFTFSAKPTALVKVINALETCERFVSVGDFTFQRTRDVINEALGGEEKKAEMQTGRGRRGRRGGAAVVEEEKKDETKNGIITDQQLDPPMTVVMPIMIYDFRSLEEVKNEEAK